MATIAANGLTTSLTRRESDAGRLDTSAARDHRHGITSLVEQLEHADDLAGRAVDAVCQRDCRRAAQDFECSLRIHCSAAVQLATQSLAARARGDHARADALEPRAVLLLWQIPGRARIAARLLRAHAEDPAAPDPAQPLRFIVETALRRSEPRELLGTDDFARLTFAARCAFFATTPPADPPAPLAAAIPEPTGSRPVAAAANRLGLLSHRERQVLNLIVQGLTNREIGARLGVKSITVNTFVSRIFAKLGVDNRAAAAAYAVRHGLQDDDRGASTYSYGDAATKRSTRNPYS